MAVSVDWDLVKSTLDQITGVRINTRLCRDYPQDLDPDAVRLVFGITDYNRCIPVGDIPLGPTILNCDQLAASEDYWRTTGRHVRALNYPEQLQPFYGRPVRRTTWGEAKTVTGRHFIKSDRKRQHPSAQIITGPWKPGSDRDLGLIYLDDDSELWISPEVKFLSEWRCFIAHGNILDVRCYTGNPLLAPNPDTVQEACRAYCQSGQAPAGFGIDFAVMAGGQTCVVEVNDGIRLGSYGLTPTLYTYLHASRWLEVMSWDPNPEAPQDWILSPMPALAV